jgi:hypothetical protein
MTKMTTVEYTYLVQEHPQLPQAYSQVVLIEGVRYVPTNRTKQPDEISTGTKIQHNTYPGE